jgi:small-conductance mechanosensitive channel
MNFLGLQTLIPTWSSLMYIGIRVVFIAIIFEVAAYLLGKRLENMASPFANLAQNRDPQWRVARSSTLQKAPKNVLRALLYTAALILVGDAFGVPLLPLSLAVGGFLLVVCSALLPLMRDYVQGFILLSEDTLAPGDAVEINGHQGIVEKWTLRATWLKDAQGRIYVLSNRDVKDVVVYKKSVAPEQKKAAFDPING